MPVYLLVLLIFAYLAGSIPTAVWTGKIFFGTDVRLQGSGNAGATNTFRVLGKKAGIFVLLFDVAKGWAGAALSFQAMEQGLISAENFLFWKMAP
jgi:glycerol-3-phosphate acyltransferase PlsY